MRLLFGILFSIVCSIAYAGPFTSYTTANGLLNNSVNCIEQGRDFVWVGTNRGLNRIVFEGNKPVKFSPRGTSVPVTCLEDDGEIIWVGLKGRGVYRMPKKNYKFLGFRKDILGDKEITGIHKTGEMVTISTSEGKVYTFKLGSETVKEEKGELAKEAIEFTSGDKKIELKSGIIARYNAPTKSYRNFKKKVNPNDGIKFRGGYLMATNSGLVFYNPANDTIQFGEPMFRLSGFSLNGNDTTAEKLDLGWDEYLFKYDFNFQELGDNDQIELSYELFGPTPSKGVAKAKDGITIKDLEYGDYQLSVKAKNGLGIEAKNELSYKFSIANPLKDSIWEYLLIAAAILIWTIIIVTITRAKLKKDIRVLEDALLEKTNRLNKLEKGKYGLVEEEKVSV